jgi:hypothetical protein
MPNVKTTGYAVLIVGMIAAALLATTMKVPASQLPEEAPAKEPLENMGNVMTAMAILFGVGLVVAVFLMVTGRMPSASIRW